MSPKNFEPLDLVQYFENAIKEAECEVARKKVQKLLLQVSKILDEPTPPCQDLVETSDPHWVLRGLSVNLELMARLDEFMKGSAKTLDLTISAFNLAQEFSRFYEQKLAIPAAGKVLIQEVIREEDGDVAKTLSRILEQVSKNVGALGAALVRKNWQLGMTLRLIGAHQAHREAERVWLDSKTFDFD